MKAPEILAVTLSNGDSALFVNGDTVASLSAGFGGQKPAEIGVYMAKAVGVPLIEIRSEVPGNDDWSWNDVYAQLPPRALPSADTVMVKHWEGYGDEKSPLDFQFDIDDQRKSNGQIFVDLGAQDGHVDDMIGITMEVGTNPLNGVDHVPCAHVHFNGDSLAVSLFKIGDRILARPERDVKIEAFRQQFDGYAETLYWID